MQRNLSFGLLDTDNGVEIFKDWITQRYLDKEITKVGRYMSDFFKQLKRSSAQDIREFNQEFDRQVCRLKEVGCSLPDVCLAWWYVDKLRMDNSTELSLLSSVGNLYSLQKLQDAATIQDRMNRRLWEKRNEPEKRRNQQAYVADNEDSTGGSSDSEMDVDAVSGDAANADDPEAQEAFVAFQNAKSKYKNILRDRGFSMSRDERLKMAKAKSYCSACHKKGHWHKDPECPKNKGKNEANAHSTHIVFYAGGRAEEEHDTFYAITDCACSRTLAGKKWVKGYIEYLNKNSIPYMAIKQKETFKFGGEKLYPSKWALVTWMNIKGEWFLVKIAVLSVDVPLLLSKPVLAALKMQYDLDSNVANFNALRLKDVNLAETKSGHPQVVISDVSHDWPLWPERIDWSLTEIFVPMAQEVYMAAAVCEKLFSSKKVPLSIQSMLIHEPFQHEAFLCWWRSKEYLRDFWIETTDYMYRIHVTPRRNSFDPTSWQTANVELKNKLLDLLDEECETSAVPCITSALPLTRRSKWHQDDHRCQYKYLWVGRSRFKRKSSTLCSADRDPSGVIHSHARNLAMEDEQGTVGDNTQGAWHECEVVMDGAGTSIHPCGIQAGARESTGGKGQPEQDDSRAVEGEMHRGGSPSSSEDDTGLSDEDAEGDAGGQRRRGGDVRVLQGVQAQRAPKEVPGMGYPRERDEPNQVPRSGTSGKVGRTQEEDWWKRLIRRTSLSSTRSREAGHSTTAGIAGSSEERQGLCGRSESEVNEQPSEEGSHYGRDRRGLLSGERWRDVISPGGEDQGPGEDDRTDAVSARRLKRRKYWDKVNRKRLAKRKKRDAAFGDSEEANSGDDYEGTTSSGSGGESDSYDSKSGSLGSSQTRDYNVEDEPVHEEDIGNRTPKVKLHYPDDYITVRKLPSHKMKRSSRKRVRSWTQKTLAALMTTLMAFSSVTIAAADQVAKPVRDVVETTMSYVTGGDGTRGDGWVDGNEESVSILELFCGTAQLTCEFARGGYSVLEPRDILLGHDLSKKEHQDDVMQDVKKFKPELIWVSMPCTLWGPWTRINYAHRKQKLRALRRKQRKYFYFLKDLIQKQLNEGRDVAIEHPRTSELWDDPIIREIVNDPAFLRVNFDMCRYDLKAKSDGGLVKKPTTVFCTDGAYCTHLEKFCQCSEPHTQAAGQNTKPAGAYTTKFAKAVLKGYKAVNKRRWISFPAEVAPERFLQGQSQDLSIEKVPTKEGASGIHLPHQVPKRVAAALRRVHQNMGHPSNEDLARHLKLGGANESVVKACKQIHCETCQRSKMSSSRRPAKVVKPVDFNEEVAIDTMHLYDSNGAKVTVLSILDVGSGYHVVKRLSGRKAEDLATTFLEAWTSWAGAPTNVLVDQERGMLKDFPDALERHNIAIRYTAGQAHWQNGHAERQNEWYRQMFDRVKEHNLVDNKEVDWAIAEVAAAKNALRRKHGYSPAQWLFGVGIRSGDGLIDEEDVGVDRQAFLKPSDDWKRRQEIRGRAREAFMQTQASDALQRAILGRPRVAHGDFEPGQYVYIYRTMLVGSLAKGRMSGSGLVLVSLLGSRARTTGCPEEAGAYVCQRASAFGRIRRAWWGPSGTSRQRRPGEALGGHGGRR